LGILIFVLGAFLTGLARQEYTAREENVGRVVMAAIGKEIVEESPGQGLMRAITTLCEEEDVYCYEASPTLEIEGRRIKYTWNIKVEFNLPYTSYDEFPIPESWRNFREGVDTATDGHIYYRQNSARPVPLGRVVVKKLKNNVMLTMTETYPVYESKDIIIQRTMERWKISVEAADKYGIFEQAPLEVLCLGGDKDGEFLDDGDVVRLLSNLDNPKPLQVEVRGKPSDLEPNESYDIHFKMSKIHRQVMQVTGQGVESTLEGFKLKTTSDNVPVSFRFDPKALKEYREVYPDGPVTAFAVRIHIIDRKKDIFVQISPWEMMITRFEIRQRAESGREYEARAQKRTVADYNLNDYIVMKGKLWDSWNDVLHPMVKRRPPAETAGLGSAFGPNEPVVMGWAINEQTGHTFLTAEDDPLQNLDSIPVYRSEADLVAEFDLEIVLDPKATVKRRASDDELEIDKDRRISETNEQPRIWREFRVDEFEMTVHEVDPEGKDIRLKAGRLNFLEGPIAKWRTGYQEIAHYVKRKVIDNFSYEVSYEGDIPVYSFGPLRKPGIYEVRLYMKVTRKADLEDFREVDVAARINVQRSQFGVRLLTLTTSRGKTGRDVPKKKRNN